MPSPPFCPFVERVLGRLWQAELHEPNPHFQCDYRIAWLTLLYAARGYSQPFVAATYSVLGLHPDKVWPAIVERRKALLGSLFEEFWGASVSVQTQPPKKPAQSERQKNRRTEAA
jgi:hypothetical protein